MSNTFEYIVALRDRVTSVADRVANSLNGIVERSRRLSNTMATSLDGMRARLQNLQTLMGRTTDRNMFRQYYNDARRLEEQIRRVENGITGSGLAGRLAGWRNDFAQSLPGGQLLQNPLAMAGAAMGGMWVATQKAMDAGKEKMKMQVLTGSAEIGTTLYDGLTKFATDTVFGTEVYDMAGQMLANGIKDANVLPIMKELGDISMGDAQKLGSLSLAFAQINGKGKLAGQELLQLINAGFNPLQVLSEKTGESMEKLQQRMEKGGIGVDEVRYAMQLATGPGGKFNAMLDKVAKTPYGQLEGLKGQLEQMVVTMGETFIPVVTKIMTLVSWLGEKMGPYLKPVVAVMGALAAGILIAAAAQWVLNLAFLANPVTWVIAGIVALIALIAYLVTSISGWGDAWKIVVNNAKLQWEFFTSGASLVWNGMVNSFMIGLNRIKSGWYEFKKAVGLGDAAESNTMIAKIAADTERRKKEFTDASKDFVEKSKAMRTGSKNAMSALSWNGSSLSDTKDSVMGALGIAPPAGVPGATKSGDKKKSGLGKTGRKSAESIATGGTRHNYITLHIKDLIGIQNYNGTRDSVSQKAGESVLDQLLRITASATTAAE
ncbi:tape measure protein [Chryseobacterium sp. MFBS3-17]|uniref:tape measure protein n=1 Tax=Chryseobacterium sp. MFBS3-17 TaxID=2886689 RepID=UPI001D0EF0A6|nr:tape measure protein [Chryseobacterium sp. MFBS3-17]MCC2590361.1 tape measure protein [Chryseobacterium sp. MFBS3-17]